MNNRGLSLLEVFLVVIVIAILGSLLLPPICGHPTRRRIACEHNLMQLYKLGVVYSSTHKGEWPEIAGEELWLSFTKTTPPLIPPEHRSILFCPVLGEERETGTDYLGPKLPWKKLGPQDPLGGDKPGNHGEGESGCVLFKDGRVEEIPGR